MRRPLFIALLFIVGSIIIGATVKEENNKPNLKGVWELQHQYFYENDEVIDTVYNLGGYRQVKMYSDSKVMWTRYNPNDSVEWFGYGTYEVKDGWLEEQLEYASYRMMLIVDTTQVFRFELEMGKNNNTFSQVAWDNEERKYYSENYKRIE